MAALTLQGVKKTYDGKQFVLHGIDVDVNDGEFVVMVGPSGCGKSTLLRMVAGLERISEGTISIAGKVVNELEPKDRNIAMVFQNYALYPHMTVAENLGFGLQLRGKPKDEIKRRVHEAAHLLQLEHRLDARPAALSGGQRQRVALGRALVREPKVFLLDEPLSNLDARLRLTMRVEIARLHRRLGTTTIYVTHDQIEAMTLGERIVVLDGGKIQQVDTPMHLYEKPANLFVAGFLGSPAMNLLRGRLHRESGWRLAMPHTVLALGELPLQAAMLDPWNDRDIVLGVRPEDLQPTTSHEHALETKLEVVEPVGNEVFLNLRFGDQMLVSRVPPQRGPAPCSSLRMGFNMERLHFFDANGGLRIT